MKTTIKIIWAVILFIIAVYIAIWAIQKITIAPLKEELLETANALEEEKKPSKIELLKQELEDNRDTRREKQSQIDELVAEKEKLSEEADEIKKEIADMVGLN